MIVLRSATSAAEDKPHPASNAVSGEIKDSSVPSRPPAKRVAIQLSILHNKRNQQCQICSSSIKFNAMEGKAKWTGCNS